MTTQGLPLGSAEHVVSLLSGFGFGCLHYTPSNSAEPGRQRYPSRLGFFHSSKQDALVLNIETKKLCLPCLLAVVPRGFHFWTSLPNPHHLGDGAAPPPMPPRRWLDTSSSSEQRIQLAQAAMNLGPLSIPMPTSPEGQRAWQYIVAQRGPFYIDQLHLIGAWSPLAERNAKKDSDTVWQHGIPSSILPATQQMPDTSPKEGLPVKRSAGISRKPLWTTSTASTVALDGESVHKLYDFPAATASFDDELLNKFDSIPIRTASLDDENMNKLGAVPVRTGSFDSDKIKKENINPTRAPARKPPSNYVAYTPPDSESGVPRKSSVPVVTTDLGIVENTLNLKHTEDKPKAPQVRVKAIADPDAPKNPNAKVKAAPIPNAPQNPVKKVRKPPMSMPLKENEEAFVPSQGQKIREDAQPSPKPNKIPIGAEKPRVIAKQASDMPGRPKAVLNTEPRPGVPARNSSASPAAALEPSAAKRGIISSKSDLAENKDKTEKQIPGVIKNGQETTLPESKIKVTKPKPSAMPPHDGRPRPVSDETLPESKARIMRPTPSAVPPLDVKPGAAPSKMPSSSKPGAQPDTAPKKETAEKAKPTVIAKDHNAAQPAKKAQPSKPTSSLTIKSDSAPQAVTPEKPKVPESAQSAATGTKAPSTAIPDFTPAPLKVPAPVKAPVPVKAPIPVNAPAPVEAPVLVPVGVPESQPTPQMPSFQYTRSWQRHEAISFSDTIPLPQLSDYKRLARTADARVDAAPKLPLEDLLQKTQPLDKTKSLSGLGTAQAMKESNVFSLLSSKTEEKKVLAMALGTAMGSNAATKFSEAPNLAVQAANMKIEGTLKHPQATTDSPGYPGTGTKLPAKPLTPFPLSLPRKPLAKPAEGSQPSFAFPPEGIQSSGLHPVGPPLGGVPPQGPPQGPHPAGLQPGPRPAGVPTSGPRPTGPAPGPHLAGLTPSGPRPAGVPPTSVPPAGPSSTGLQAGVPKPTHGGIPEPNFRPHAPYPQSNPSSKVAETKNGAPRLPPNHHQDSSQSFGSQMLKMFQGFSTKQGQGPFQKGGASGPSKPRAAPVASSSPHKPHRRQGAVEKPHNYGFIGTKPGHGTVSGSNHHVPTGHHLPGKTSQRPEAMPTSQTLPPYQVNESFAWGSQPATIVVVEAPSQAVTPGGPTEEVPSQTALTTEQVAEAPSQTTTPSDPTGEAPSQTMTTTSSGSVAPSQNIPSDGDLSGKPLSENVLPVVQTGEAPSQTTAPDGPTEEITSQTMPPSVQTSGVPSQTATFMDTESGTLSLDVPPGGPPREVPSQNVPPLSPVAATTPQILSQSQDSQMETGNYNPLSGGLAADYYQKTTPKVESTLQTMPAEKQEEPPSSLSPSRNPKEEPTSQLGTPQDTSNSDYERDVNTASGGHETSRSTSAIMEQPASSLEKPASQRGLVQDRSTSNYNRDGNAAQWGHGAYYDTPVVNGQPGGPSDSMSGHPGVLQPRVSQDGNKTIPSEPAGYESYNQSSFYSAQQNNWTYAQPPYSPESNGHNSHPSIEITQNTKQGHSSGKAVVAGIAVGAAAAVGLGAAAYLASSSDVDNDHAEFSETDDQTNHTQEDLSEPLYAQDEQDHGVEWGQPRDEEYDQEEYYQQQDHDDGVDDRDELTAAQYSSYAAGNHYEEHAGEAGESDNEMEARSDHEAGFAASYNTESENDVHVYNQSDATVDHVDVEVEHESGAESQHEADLDVQFGTDDEIEPEVEAAKGGEEEDDFGAQSEGFDQGWRQSAENVENEEEVYQEQEEEEGYDGKVGGEYEYQHEAEDEGGYETQEEAEYGYEHETQADVEHEDQEENDYNVQEEVEYEAQNGYEYAAEGEVEYEAQEGYEYGGQGEVEYEAQEDVSEVQEEVQYEYEHEAQEDVDEYETQEGYEYEAEGEVDEYETQEELGYEAQEDIDEYDGQEEVEYEAQEGYEYEAEGEVDHDAQQDYGGEYEAQQEYGGGYEAQEEDGEYEVQQEYEGGYEAQESYEGGYEAQEDSGEGYEAQESYEGGYEAQEDYDGGYEAQEDYGGGYEAQEDYGGDGYEAQEGYDYEY